jgi:hypothetical protein
MNAQSLEQGREEHWLRARTALFWVVTLQLLRGVSLKSRIGVREQGVQEDIWK